MLPTFLSRLRLVTAASALRLFPFALFLACAAVYLIVAAQPAPRPLHPYAPQLQDWAEHGVYAGIALAVMGWVFRKAQFSPAVESSDFKFFLLSVEAGMLLLVVPAYMYVFKSRDEDIRWILDSLFDKRWKFALYWLGMGTFLFLPYLFRFLFRFLPEAPARATKIFKSKQARATESVSEPAVAQPAIAAQRGGLALRIVLSVAGAAALAYFYAGPPWHLDRNHQVIDLHEQVHLGPLQAMDRGYLAYVGPASTQYGPGSQIFVYAFMRWRGMFDLVSYREAGAAIFCVSTFLFCFVAAMLLPAWAVLPALWLALLYSPFTFYQWGADGALKGFYGWANALRYMGILFVAAFLPKAVRVMGEHPRRWISGRALALGLVWGLFSWLAQENLSSTVAASTLLLSVLWFSGTASGRSVLKIGTNMIAGFLLFWSPVMGYYGIHGAAGEFLRCYFLVPSMVVQGYSNTDWSSGVTDREYLAFCYTALVVIALGIVTLVDWRTLRLCSPLPPKRVRMFGFLCALAASYPASLFRSDTSHLRATLTALPLVILLAVVDLPEWLASGMWARRAWRLSIAAALLSIYPLWRGPAEFSHTVAFAPLIRFAPAPAIDAPSADSRIPFQRTTRFLADEPRAFDGAPPMREFLEEMSALREIVGTRATFIESFPRTMLGLVYFLLDLKAAPYLLDKDLLVVNEEVEREALAYYEQHAAETECLITMKGRAPELEAFQRAHPGYTKTRRKMGKSSYFVYLAPEASARAASLAK